LSTTNFSGGIFAGPLDRTLLKHNLYFEIMKAKIDANNK
jgi:hypothetical protein